MNQIDAFASVRAALGQRVADARFLGAGKANRGAHKDADDMAPGERGEDTLPAVFHLTYEDSNRRTSTRVVTVRRIERRSDRVMIHGLCHLRGKPRCFSADRIEEVFDVTTGEVFGDASAFFTQHPLFTDPREPEQEALKVCRHEINLLTVVGASDGLFDPDEQDVLMVHVFNRCDHLNLDESTIRQRLALIAPDQPSFSRSLMQMHRFKAGDTEALFRTMRKMVEADGSISKEEVLFVDEITNYLRPDSTPAFIKQLRRNV